MKRNGFALAAAILGTIGFALSAAFYYSSTWPFEVGTKTFFEITLSNYIIPGAVAISLNWAAWWKNAKTPMLVASILYIFALVYMFASILFFLLCIIFGFIAYAQIKEQAEE